MIHWTYLLGAFALGWWLNGRRWQAILDDALSTARQAVDLIKTRDAQVNRAVGIMNGVSAALDVHQTRKRARVFQATESAGFPAKGPASDETKDEADAAK